jgi:hypothetical protein
MESPRTLPLKAVSDGRDIMGFGIAELCLK